MSDLELAFRTFEQKINALRDTSSQQFDYTKPKDNRAARSQIHAMRAMKGEIERVRKEEKAASLEYGRKVDASAKALTGELDNLIAVHAVPLRKLEEQEQQRVDSLRDRLKGISDATNPVDEDGSPWGSNYLASKLEQIRNVALDDSWQEFLAEAGQAKDAAITALERHLDAAKKREHEAAEVDRLRQEREARERQDLERAQAEAAKDRERKAAEAAAQQARKNAEQAAQKAQEEHEAALRRMEQKAAQEKERAERQLREQKEAAERRELQLRLETERKERERLQAEEQERREKEKRARDEKRRKLIEEEIATAFLACGLTTESAGAASLAIMHGRIPHVIVNY